MASLSYPDPAYNSGALSDLEYERLAGPQAADGLIADPADPPMVWADGTGTRRVFVLSNRRALIRGFEYDSGPTTTTLTLAANGSGVTRIDLIVLRLDRATWTVREAVVQGTPGAGAPARTMNTGSIGVWEFPLAEVTVDPGASAIAAGQVVTRAWQIGSDGQIRCTDQTRPPHEQGRRIWEMDTGRLLVSTGSGWDTVREDTGWTSFSPIAGKWSSIECAVRRRNGFTSLRLRVSRIGSLSADTEDDVAVIPAGFRPGELRYVSGVIVTGSGVARMSISSGGTVRILQHAVAIGNTGWLEMVDTYPS